MAWLATLLRVQGISAACRLARCALKESPVRRPFLCNAKSSWCRGSPATQGSPSPSSFRLHFLARAVFACASYWCHWLLEPPSPPVTGVQEGGGAACLPSLSVAQKQGCDAASSSGPAAGAAAFPARRSSPAGSAEDRGHCLWASGRLHCKEPVVQLGLVFPHQWCSRVRKVRRAALAHIKAASVQSLVGVPAAAAMAHAGLHCPALLAPPLLWSCPPALGLWDCLCAVKLNLAKIREANVFFRCIP